MILFVRIHPLIKMKMYQTIRGGYSYMRFLYIYYRSKTENIDSMKKLKINKLFSLYITDFYS